MNKQTKLQKLIEIAVENGFDFDSNYGGFRGPEELLNGNWDFPGGFYYKLLFSHDFAKAVFGEGRVEHLQGFITADSFFEADDGQLWYTGKMWQYRLQQAVISDDPLEYFCHHTKK